MPGLPGEPENRAAWNSSKTKQGTGNEFGTQPQDPNVLTDMLTACYSIIV